ncbi:MAG TPA: hypothetical protein VHM91_25250 [Verrucomicrobiales bacterium]|nr:hypothetical protein [Verrucomicrobiales bacterium]
MRLFLLSLFAAVTAKAHPILQNPLWIDPSPKAVTLYLDVSVRELIVVQGCPVSKDGEFDLLMAGDFAAKHEGYLLDHIHVKADGQTIKGTVREVLPPEPSKDHKPGLEAPDVTRFRFVIDYPLGETPPAVLSFSHNMCVEFPSSPGIAWDLSYLYRYGTVPGGTPRAFGPLRGDEELNFRFAGALIEEAMPIRWAVLWLLFVAAMALGSPLRLFWYQTAAIVWMGVYLGTASYTGYIPLWLMALPGGAATILAAVDNIHSHDTDIQPRRRVALLLTGTAFFAMGLAYERMILNNGERMWPVVMFLSANAAAALIRGLKGLAAKSRPSVNRLCLQLSSLAVCALSIWLLLILLKIK